MKKRFWLYRFMAYAFSMAAGALFEAGFGLVPYVPFSVVYQVLLPGVVVVPFAVLMALFDRLES